MSECLDIWMGTWEPDPCPCCGAPYNWEEVLAELRYLRNERGILARLFNVQYPHPGEGDEEKSP